ncbi:MAG: hypothetical protein RJA96_189 [Actinomycetota bacterium]|jgi:hypothetical protein
MTKKYRLSIALGTAALIFGGGLITADTLISSRIESRVYQQIPDAADVSVSIPLRNIPSDLTSDSIKLANINVGRSDSGDVLLNPSLSIAARNIAKKQPNIVGSLEVTAMIPAATITQQAEFEDAQIVGNTLQIAVGSGGLGRASLVPKFSKNQLFFELKSVSLFGSEIPASSLPTDIQEQIKSQSMRELSIPKGMKVKSVSLSSKGLALKLYGNNIQFGNLGTIFKESK